MSNAPTNPPHGVIARELRNGQVVPFLGAGVNFGARPPNEQWRPTSLFLPSGKELSCCLAEEANLVDNGNPRDVEDLAKVASYYVDTYDGDRRPLREYLRRIFVRGHVSAKIHEYLAAEALHYLDGESPYAKIDDLRAARGTPLLIVTTNYDDLTEKAFEALGRPYDLVIYPTDSTEYADSVLWWKDGERDRLPTAIHPNSLRINLARTNVIYKMHGSIDRLRSTLDSFVITEEDYVDFLSRMTAHAAIPMQFMRHFRNRRFLFLGYGLNDWNLRVVLRNLRTMLPTAEDAKSASQGTSDKAAPAVAPNPASSNTNLQSWAIQHDPPDVDVALWRARKVRIFDQDIDTFADGLRAFAERNLEVTEALL